MKVVISDKKTGKSAQLEVPKDKEAMLMGTKISESIDGFVVGIEGYKLQITGLSDKSGAPSLKGVSGTRSVHVLLTKNTRVKQHGFRKRLLVKGDTISATTEQINTIITEYGSKPTEELFKPKAKEEAK